MLGFFMLCSSINLLVAHSPTIASPVVDLSYTSYRGVSLPNGVTQWLGMRYAAPPLGELRFRAPQDPLTKRIVHDADAFGPICLGTEQGPPTEETAEDCLFLNVFAPTSATNASNLPVCFFIGGGGFNENANANYNGSGLVVASGMSIVVVNFNYRVSLYGFLASEEIATNGSLNNGLKDQRKALEWTQSHIYLFGGDPTHVVLSGDSAGAQSVNLHVTAYGGRNDRLFHATTTESQSFSPLNTVNESQFAYDNLVIRTGCTSAEDTLSCLRTIDATTLQMHNINTTHLGAQNPSLFMYNPTLDFDFITDYTYRAYAEGKFVRVPALAGFDTDEGTIFTSPDTSSLAESDTFIHDQFPDMTLAQLRLWNRLYPLEGTKQFPGRGRFWRQVSKGYGELRYICPGIFISAVQAETGVPNWNFRWNVIDPVSEEEGYGVTHTIEIHAIWGPENTNKEAPPSYYPNGSNHAIVPIMQAYWTSFIRTFDPNPYRLAHSPVWHTWTWREGYGRLRVQTNDTGMEVVGREQRGRCRILRSFGVGIGQ